MGKFSQFTIPLIVILILFLPSVSAWFDSNYTFRYSLNVTESTGLNRIFEPMKVNVSGITCNYVNKSDLKFIYGDTSEIPIQLLTDGVTAILTPNITANFNGVLGYFYCNSSTMRSAYTTGFIANASGTIPLMAFTVLPGINNIKYNFYYGDLAGARIDNGANFTWSETQGFNLVNGTNKFIFGSATVPGGQPNCSMTENGSVYYSYSCNSTKQQLGYTIKYEFYMMNSLYRITGDTDGNNRGLVAWTQNLGGGMPSEQKYVTHINTSNIWVNITGSPAAYQSLKAIISAWSLTQLYGFTVLFNDTLVYTSAGADLSGAYLRSNTGDPNGNIGGANVDVVVPKINWTQQGSEAGRLFMGYTLRDTVNLNQTYTIKMNPILVSLGSQQQEALTPTLIFNSQIPSNLTSLNFINKVVNLTFNFTYINTSTFTLNFKTNSTISDVYLYINGTQKTGFQTEPCSNISSNQAVCNLDDNEILPGTYIIDFEEHEDISHVPVYNLTGSNDYVKLGLYNMTTISYGFFEFMVNSTTNDTYPIIFCNSSYTAGNPTTSPYCSQFASFIGNLAYNHSHVYSSHRVRSFALNSSTGRINGIKVTPLSYFLFTKDTGATLQVWGINNKSNPNLVQSSANGGNTWSTNGNIAPDYHVHQIADPSTFYYQLCANSSIDNAGVCSALKSDLIELTLIAPTVPDIAPIPELIKQNTTITVNWSKANDPNNLDLSYNLSQYNITGFMTSYEGNNTYLTHNFTEALGNYSFNVRAKNSAGLVSGFTTSNQFWICAVNFNCTQFHVCDINNISKCEAVTDLGCEDVYAGNLSDYDKSCVFIIIPTPTSLTTIDLTSQTNVILFGLFLFFWIGLAIISLTFKNFVFGSMMFFIGVLLGFWSFSISWFLSAVFLFFSALLLMRTAKFH